jgi:hypothetical protein
MPQELFRFNRPFAVLVGVLMLAGCGGGGTGGSPSGGGNPPPSPPSGSTVTVTGRVTFDRLQFSTVPGAGLNATTPVVSPAREVVVEAVTGNNVVSTTTDSNGNYSLSVPANSNAFIRVRAQMLKEGTAPTWNFTVKNNTNSDAVYVLQGDTFATGTANVTRDIHAASGWTGTTYDDNGRLAAPFAILDTVYHTKQLILSASPNAALPQLNLYWSTQNRTDNGIECAAGDTTCVDDDPFCPDRGNIGTSFYFNDPSNQTTDRCSPSQPLLAGIYILGAYQSGNGDTDEFDQHVIAHEFGHYFEDRFSRSDSIGGQHSTGDRLDLRLAFGEGWGNAFGAMSLNDPLYRDSSSGISTDFSFNLESDSSTHEGWFSEASVGEILWDIFDNNATPEPGDNVALGFAPIFAVMNNQQVNTDAFTSIFSFAAALEANNGAAAGAIDNLLNGEAIDGNDAFGAGESNTGGDPRALPVYYSLALNTPFAGVCSSSVAGSDDRNKLGNRRFLRFVNDTQRLVTITAMGAASGAGTIAAEDPDILVYRRGQLVVAGESSVANREDISQQQLPAGTYILEVYDYNLSGTNTQPRCMTISITG